MHERFILKVDILLPAREQMRGGIARRDDQATAGASEVAPAADLHWEFSAHHIGHHAVAHKAPDKQRPQK